MENGHWKPRGSKSDYIPFKCTWERMLITSQIVNFSMSDLDNVYLFNHIHYCQISYEDIFGDDPRVMGSALAQDYYKQGINAVPSLSVPT